MNSDFQKKADFKIGEIVKHRLFSFRGVIFDVDPEFMNTEEWYASIPADMRPKKINLFIIYLQKVKKVHILPMSHNKTYLKMIAKNLVYIHK